LTRNSSLPPPGSVPLALATGVTPMASVLATSITISSFALLPAINVAVVDAGRHSALVVTRTSSPIGQPCRSLDSSPSIRYKLWQAPLEPSACAQNWHARAGAVQSAHVVSFWHDVCVAHGGKPQSLVSNSGGQSDAFWITLRSRVELPEPHVAGHAVQVDHSVTTHAHCGICAHGRRSLSASQAAPPFAGATCTMRWRCSSPLPLVCEHALQFDHALSLQSIAHATVAEHGSVWSSAGHSVPSHIACVASMRTRVRVPPLPHVTEQLDQVVHAVTMQSTGQQPKLQDADSFSSGHGVPPCAAARVVQCACATLSPTHRKSPSTSDHI
jgi:hypothetical protein